MGLSFAREFSPKKEQLRFAFGLSLKTTKTRRPPKKQILILITMVNRDQPHMDVTKSVEHSGGVETPRPSCFRLVF